MSPDEIKKNEENKKEERVTIQYKTVTLADGKEYTVKPLTLKDTKDLLPSINKMDQLRNEQGITGELIDLMADICFKILNRTNTELTKEQINDVVEMGSVYDIIVLGIGQTK